MIYTKLTSGDADIPALQKIHDSPETARFIHISENYWNYVTSSEGVYYFIAYDGDVLAGSVHIEIAGQDAYISLLVIPQLHGRGYGTKILRDVISGTFGLNYTRICASVEETNAISLALFKKCGFIETSRDDGLIDFIYQK